MNADHIRSISHTPLVRFSLAFGFALVALHAGALEMPPGKWAINSETTAPMAPEPIVDYTEDCIQEDFDPLSLIQAEMTEQCQITTNVDTDTELDADLQCTIPGAITGNLVGKLLFSVDGNNAAGQMNMSVDMGGQIMAMSSKWSAQRLGACD